MGLLLHSLVATFLVDFLHLFGSENERLQASSCGHHDDLCIQYYNSFFAFSMQCYALCAFFLHLMGRKL